MKTQSLAKVNIQWFKQIYSVITASNYYLGSLSYPTDQQHLQFGNIIVM